MKFTVHGDIIGNHRNKVGNTKKWVDSFELGEVNFIYIIMKVLLSTRWPSG